MTQRYLGGLDAEVEEGLGGDEQHTARLDLRLDPLSQPGQLLHASGHLLRRRVLAQCHLLRVRLELVKHRLLLPHLVLQRVLLPQT